MLPDPIDAKDLNIYGDDKLSWSRARKSAEAGIGLPETPAFLSTADSDGRPHTTGIGAVEYDGFLYFTSGPGTLKSRNLIGNPACTLAYRFAEADLIFDGHAHRTTDIAELDAVTAVYRAGGWPAERAGDTVNAPYSAQSAGPGPWYLYRFTIHTAVGVALTDPHGATRWRFA
ncbi:pyridoxamine 5'-phosphate oxidase family protein [Nocardia sp. NBC_01503]|uniref:pyridoxamine 5'-phosphate oxidase family protein n=1 Tax=Nocardia sp. NBC_01503 TaxID=2975997 RepID=UPI002E7C36EB|nr:pyridoxamine 5'-phosphate oxidase family protein [Nocardia sp. NBC_01503]WTL29309.1 pyridoxamine 5'-phosphate oxidase family protein [Nocardia sp. NBC_01503]